MCRECMKTDTTLATEYLVKLSDELEITIGTVEDLGLLKQLFELHKKTVFLAAPYSFHCYLLALEWNRPPERKFYPPRRKVLKTLVDDLQDLADKKLDFLGIKRDLA
mgnify:CR=1 FL=1